MTTRLRTRTRIELAAIDRLLDQVGVARELVRGTIDPRFGSVLTGLAPATADRLVLASHDLASAQNKLDQALETLRALRHDA